MAKFVECKDGKSVNLDRVAFTKRHYCEKNRTVSHELFDDKDILLGVVGPHRLQSGLVTGTEVSFFSEVTDPIVPANPGATGYFMGCDDDGIDRPTASDVWFEQHAIVAWRIHLNDAPVAIFDDTPSPDAIGLIVLPAGKLMVQGIIVYDDMADAKMAMLEHAQKRWDANAKLKAVR